MRVEPLSRERDPGMADTRRCAFVRSERSDSERSDAVRVWDHLFPWRIHDPEREQLGREAECLAGGQASAAIGRRAFRAGAAQLLRAGTAQTGNVQAGLTAQSVIVAAAFPCVISRSPSCKPLQYWS